MGQLEATHAEIQPPITVHINQSDSQSWDDYVLNQTDASLYHEIAWLSLIRNVYGHETFSLTAHDNKENTVGILPLVYMHSILFGKFLVSMPYLNYGGVLADTPDVSDALLRKASELCNRLGGSHLELRHRKTIGNWPAKTDKVTMMLELPASHDELWKSFKPKLRAQIRRPEKEGAHCTVGGVELLDDFYRVFSNNMRDLGTPVYPKRFAQAILEQYPEKSRLFVVYLNQIPAAAALVLGHRSTLEIPWASSIKSMNRFGVNMSLYWNVLKWAIETNYSNFDFGRCTPNSGTFRFKKQWGSNPKQLYWQYWLPQNNPLPQLNPSNPKYAFFIRAWQRLPLSVANRIGPWLIKGIP